MTLHKLARRASAALAVLMVLAFFMPGAFALSPASTPTQGADVSVDQGQINFDELKEAKISFVYIKAGEGADITDSYFEENYRRASAADMKFGFYYYVTATNTAEAVFQAERFAQLISGKSYSARPAMDFESFGSLSAEQINAIGAAFLSTLAEKTGVTPAIYTDAFAAGSIWDSSFSAYPLWVADYESVSEPPDNPVWSSWAGWQYADDGELAGIKTRVDLDYFTDALLLADTEKGEIPAGPAALRYVVRRGDTLWCLSRRYQTSVAELAQLNHIANPDFILVGQILVIPLPDGGQLIYYVKAGDTLWAIAQKYDTTVSAIAQINHLFNPNLILVGQRLLIPA